MRSPEPPILNHLTCASGSSNYASRFPVSLINIIYVQKLNYRFLMLGLGYSESPLAVFYSRYPSTFLVSIISMKNPSELSVALLI